MATIDFTVLGIPIPKGSKKAITFMKGGKARASLVDANSKTKPWAAAITTIAQQYAPAGGPLEGPIRLTLCFYMPRPKSVTIKKRPHHVTKPDLDKLVRTLKDALKGVMYCDDSQVNEMYATKDYADTQAPGVTVRLES